MMAAINTTSTPCTLSLNLKPAVPFTIILITFFETGAEYTSKWIYGTYFLASTTYIASASPLLPFLDKSSFNSSISIS